MSRGLVTPIARKGDARCRDCATRWEAKCPTCLMRIKKRGMAIPDSLACPTCGMPMMIQRLMRKALWCYAKRIYFCNPCWEAWSAESDFDPQLVERLSDDEQDFDRVNTIRVTAAIALCGGGA